MSKGKLLTTRLVVLALILVGLIVAFPAGAHVEECPPGWQIAGSFEAPNQDHNGDGSICRTTIPGGGQGNGTIPGFVYKDNHQPHPGQP